VIWVMLFNPNVAVRVSLLSSLGYWSILPLFSGRFSLVGCSEHLQEVVRHTYEQPFRFDLL
jgi:hypothetical protein